MIAELSSTLSSTKAAYDIAKSIRELQSDVERNESISNILEALISAQAQALAVQEKTQELVLEKHELIKKLMEFEKWAQTEQQYELKEIAPGTFVYSYKKADGSSQPQHWLCSKCYQERKAQIIQLDRVSAGGRNYFCPNCKTPLIVRFDTPQSASPNHGV